MQLRQQLVRQFRQKRLFFLNPLFWIRLSKFALQTAYNIFRFVFYFKKYDAVFFIFGNSFSLGMSLVYFNDLFWLKLIRMKIIFIYCGSDSRPAFVDGAILANFDEI